MPQNTVAHMMKFGNEISNININTADMTQSLTHTYMRKLSQRERLVAVIDKYLHGLMEVM